MDEQVGCSVDRGVAGCDVSVELKSRTLEYTNDGPAATPSASPTPPPLHALVVRHTHDVSTVDTPTTSAPSTLPQPRRRREQHNDEGRGFVVPPTSRVDDSSQAIGVYTTALDMELYLYQPGHPHPPRSASDVFDALILAYRRRFLPSPPYLPFCNTTMRVVVSSMVRTYHPPTVLTTAATRSWFTPCRRFVDHTLPTPQSPSTTPTALNTGLRRGPQRRRPQDLHRPGQNSGGAGHVPAHDVNTLHIPSHPIPSASSLAHRRPQRDDVTCGFANTSSSLPTGPQGSFVTAGGVSDVGSAPPSPTLQPLDGSNSTGLPTYLDFPRLYSDYQLLLMVSNSPAIVIPVMPEASLISPYRRWLHRHGCLSMSTALYSLAPSPASSTWTNRLTSSLWSGSSQSFRAKGVGSHLALTIAPRRRRPSCLEISFPPSRLSIFPLIPLNLAPRSSTSTLADGFSAKEDSGHCHMEC
ncbi:hypothetical protein BKA70DRAFT_1417514 [Coprinopsis sp. MPI-PUGE-AT-0042]|nr:hypothetical protein BKA70DRAFT_1417514 [Coprinopsis sp. MPI-PUGE-AT-0042]